MLVPDGPCQCSVPDPRHSTVKVDSSGLYRKWAMKVLLCTSLSVAELRLQEKKNIICM